MEKTCEPFEYDGLIVVTPADFKRLEVLYPRLLETLPVRKLLFIGSGEVGELLKEAALGERVDFIDENSIIPFDKVYEVMSDALVETYPGKIPRGVVGWYYQQFLKLQYAFSCPDEYYLVWDGDTVPCKNFSMFKEGTQTPYFDMKTEYNERYFETISLIFPEMYKCLGKSFISEHMLFNKALVKQMLEEIEGKDNIKGRQFYEKIVNVIEPSKLLETSFSEFETYGTYVAFRNPSLYRLKDWHSIRYGSVYFKAEELTEEDFDWLGRDFDAVSFEKNMDYNDDIAAIFINPKYREQLTARQIIEAIQDASSEGMKETWE